MNTEVMRHALAGSLAGQLTFPQVVGMLAEAGVESYRVDFITHSDVFYLADGRTHAEPMPPTSAPVATDLDTAELAIIIRAAQADTLRYPEFVDRAIAAGVAAYQVFITGRKVIYFGRQGDVHVEHFPSSKPASQS
jgi:uncharacterized protein YbcV (DUF1398 family)